MQEKIDVLTVSPLFSQKMTAKPKTLKLIEENVKMITAKSQSLQTEFERLKSLVTIATNSTLLEGMNKEGDRANKTKQRQQ